MNSSKLKAIRNSVCYHSELAFQNKVAIILGEYYKIRGLTYENPNPAGGDDKNDGWVKDAGIYYQMYSPTNYPKSFTKSVLEKFVEDATGLFANVYDKNIWRKPINEFIFIVNTRDASIPKDSGEKCKKCIDELNEKYKTDVKYKLVNFDYLADLLLEIDDEKVERNLIIKLEVDDLLNYSEINEKSMLDFLGIISSCIHKSMLLDSKGTDYKRISSERKITINNLKPIKEKINTMIRKLWVVENAISIACENNPASNVGVIVIDFVIGLYNKNKELYLGVELYNKILEDILNIAPELEGYDIPAEMFIVYVFDKCDIFKKEK